MKTTTLEELTFTMAVDGPALSASTVRTSILDTTTKAGFVIPANFWEVGKQIEVVATGRISNVVTTPGTLVLDLDFLSGASTHVQPFASQAMALNTTAKTNVTWQLYLLLTCRAVGSGTAANLMATGNFMSESVVGSPAPSAGGAGALSIPASAPAVGSGFDSTVAQTLDLFATFSVNTAGTAITCHQFSVFTLN